MVELGRLDEARASFETIARWNGQVLDWNEEIFKRPATADNLSYKAPPLSFWLK
jgi:hypothetical protein